MIAVLPRQLKSAAKRPVYSCKLIETENYVCGRNIPAFMNDLLLWNYVVKIMFRGQIQFLKIFNIWAFIIRLTDIHDSFYFKV